MRIIASVVTGATIVVTAGSARAQLIDYTALEQLFGEPVTTSVTGSPQRQSDVPATMEIITADDIRRSGATDIPGVLRNVVGVDVLQSGMNQADVSVRGYNQVYSSSLLVLIDGRQVYADYYGYTPWSTLPIELGAIRQIEIVKGPNSALFGFNAARGVINIVTYNPLFDTINTASLTGGTQGFAQGSAIGTVKIGDRAAVRLSAGGRRNDEFSTPPELAYSGLRRDGDRGAVDMNAVVRLSDKMALELSASHVSANQSEIPDGSMPAYVHYETNSVKARFSADTSMGLLQVTAYSNWINSSYKFAPNNLIGFPQFDFANNVTVVQAQDSLKLGTDHTVRATLEYRHNTVGTSPTTWGTIYYDVVAAGGMWQWQILPNLTLTNALRVDYLMLGRSGSVTPGYPFTNGDWYRSITALSFNSGIVWKATSEDTLRLLASRGVQLPNLAALGAAQITTPFPFTGVPYLTPTVVTNYELGWEHKIPSLNTQFRAAAFYQTTNDVASLSGGSVPVAGGQYFASANVMNSIAYGLELELKGKFLTDWRWGLSYTPELVYDYYFAGQTSLSSQTTYALGTPVHTVSANLGWSHGPWEIDGFVRYKSRFYGFQPVAPGATTMLVPIDDYVSLDARIAYQLNERITLAVAGQNITTQTQTQTAGPGVERRVYGTISAKF